MLLESRQLAKELATLAKERPPSTRQWPLMAGEMAWNGADLGSGNQLFHCLTPEQIQEAEFAVSDFKDLDLDVPDVDRNNFVLPTLGKELLSGCRDLHDGKGFFVLRGFDPKKYSAEDNLLMFLGISSYIGEDRAKQDSRGNIAVHLHHDTAKYPVSGVGTSRHSNKFSKFHSDNYADVVALHVRDIAAEGGAFKLASAWNVYNRLVASRPDLVEALASEWTFNRRGKMFPQVDRPILFIQDGRVMMDFCHSSVSGVLRDSAAAISRLSQVQNEALKEVERLAQEDELVFNLQPGDMVFLNNHGLLHSREAFRNDAAHVRHIVRLWLKNSELAWKLPPALEKGNRRMFYENEIRERWAVKISSSPRRAGGKEVESPSSGSH